MGLSTKIQSKNIVIVDDEPLVTSSLKAFLAIEGNYNPVIFNSPVEALEYIEKSEVDLVISDFLMPNMNGIEFLKEVKKINSGITLILLTGYADKENAIKAINEVGLYRYLEKPWDNDDLLLCIKNGLERSHLLANLENKIEELSEAKKELEQYNDKLEKTVKERTLDLYNSNTELKNVNTKLEAIINYCADGIITTTKEGVINQVNPSLQRICGSKGSEIANKKLSEILKSDNNEIAENRLDMANQVMLREYKIQNKRNNKLIPVEVSFAPIKSDDLINHFVGVIRDITPQYEMERLREDFIATLTHDLRTPLLAAIQTLGFFLDNSLGDLSDRQKMLLDTMLHSNKDMLGLVNALLEVYKYESGQLVLCKDYFDINDLISQNIREIESLLEKKEISIKISSMEQVSIFADKQELKRVLANLIGNAINYTPSGGKILILAREINKELILTVEDNGIGVPKEDIPNLFNRFSQGTSTKRSTGTGLGLYLSRQIIEAHCGKIWLESESGKGSKFSFSIPIDN